MKLLLYSLYLKCVFLKIERVGFKVGQENLIKAKTNCVKLDSHFETSCFPSGQHRIHRAAKCE